MALNENYTQCLYLNAINPLAVVRLVKIHPSHDTLAMAIISHPFPLVDIAAAITSHTIPLSHVIYPVALVER